VPNATRFAGILELRTAKYADYARVAATCPAASFVVVRYEDLAAHDGKFFVDRVRAILNDDASSNAVVPAGEAPTPCLEDFVKVDGYAKFGHIVERATKPAVYRSHMTESTKVQWTRADWDVFLEKLDRDGLEKSIGYVYDAREPGVFRTLPTVSATWLVVPPATETSGGRESDALSTTAASSNPRTRTASTLYVRSGAANERR